MKSFFLFSLAVVALGLQGQRLEAAKLVEVRPVDEQILMVHLKDGEVFYRDNGEGPSAFTGHDFAEGDDRLVSYGEKVDPTAAVETKNWALLTQRGGSDDVGLNPSAVHRKSKVMGNTHDWQYHLDHWFFLRLPTPLRNGEKYTLRIDPSVKSDQTEISFTYDLNTSQSEAIHVNLIGYTPTSPVKAADLYLWLGDGGPRDYRSFEGNPVWLYDVASGQRHEVGKVTFGAKNGPDVNKRNMTGSDVWHVDFSSFDRPGQYRLVVAGVGASAPFEIKPDVWTAPFRTAVQGYYFMRIGEPKEAPVAAPPRQPRFLPGEDPKGFTVYLTDFDPYDPEWKTLGGDTWDEPHFKPAANSYFWNRRLPGHPTNPHARGGRSDALDWDRHLGHVSDIYDLLLPYLLSRGALSDDATGIAESGNGIPDLIDEARNEVDMWLRLRVGDAYAHGLTNPTRERTMMFQAGVTTMAAWANAANTAILAESFRLSGQTDLRDYYRDEAIRAFRFAERQENQQLDDLQEIGDAWMRGRDFRMMAASFLYNVTGDTAWENLFVADSVAKDKVVDIEKSGEWVQTWASVGYLYTPQPQNHPGLVANLKASIRLQALENNVRWMDTRPSRRSSNNNHWQTAHNVQLVAIAHALSTDAAERERLEKSLILEADWGLGRNPSNMVEMTGLGSRRVENIYTSGRNDGVPGLHPGHTPYNNLDPWGKDNGSNPHWFTDRGYPEWEKGGWPHQEAYFNSRYCWSNGEFTPRQTMRGKMALYGYLASLALPSKAALPGAR